jgi:hypothetical protein
MAFSSALSWDDVVEFVREHTSGVVTVIWQDSVVVTKRTDWRGYRVNRNRPLQSGRLSAVLGKRSGRAAIVVPASSAIEKSSCTNNRERFVWFCAARVDYG